MRRCCTLEIHPLKSVDTLNRKNHFFGNCRKDPSDVVDFQACGRFQFFYRKSANVCDEKSVRKSANLNLESTICGFANLQTGLRKCPALLFSKGKDILKPKRFGLSDEYFEMLDFLKGN